MPVPRWLQTNPYRILRLSANASMGDAHKAASAMRRRAVLGMTDVLEADIPSLGPLPRSDMDIRAAVGRLENPPQRLADRLFWFHSATDRAGGEAGGDLRVPLKRASWQHDQALGYLIQVCTSAEHDPMAWVEPLRVWRQSVENDDYWKLSSVIEELGSFEPQVNRDEIRTLRGNAMMMASEPLLMLAREAVAHDDRKQLEAALKVLRDLSDSGDWTTSARREILAPLTGSVSDGCRLNREQFSGLIVHKTEAVDANRPICDDALRHLRTSVEPSLKKLRSVVAKGEEEDRLAQEEVAQCLRDIAIDFTWADRFIESEALLKEALAAAEGTLLAVQIERDLAENKNSADRQRLYDGLTSEGTLALHRTQRLCRSVLADGRKQIIREPDKSGHNKPICHAMLAKFRSDVQPSMRSALAMIPTEHPAGKGLRAEVALCLNAIATDFTWADEFVLSLQLREEALAVGTNTDAVDSINQGIAEVRESAQQEKLFSELIPIKNAPGLSTINGIGGRLYGSSDYDATTKSFATTYYFTFFYLPILPLGRYRVIQEGKSYRFLGKLPLRKFDKWHLGIVLGLVLTAILYGAATSDSSTQSSQPTYAPSSASSTSDVSTSDSSRITLKNQIDAGRARLEVLKTELEPVANEQEALKGQLQELDSQIKALDDQRTSGEAIDVDDYNSKVNRYNDLVAQRETLYAEHKASLDEYQELSKRDDELVSQYNALAR